MKARVPRSRLVGASEAILGRIDLRLKVLKEGGWMLAATVAAGVFNYLANVLVGRMLGPVDYGVYTSLLSIYMILTMATTVARTVVTNSVARLCGSGALTGVGPLTTHLLKRSLPWGIGGAVVLALSSGLLGAALHISSTLPIIVSSLSVVPMSLLPVVNGVLAGLQRFGALGVMQIGLAMLRLLAVVGLVALGLGATGAVASLPLSNLGAVAIGTLLLSDLFRRRSEGTLPELNGLFEQYFHVALAMVSFAALINCDVILVKSQFSPADAGLYSAITVLGKTVLWLSGAIAVLLLPKATEQHSSGRSTRRMLRLSLLVVSLLSGGVTIVFFLFPTIVVGVFFGEQYLDGAPLLGLYGLAMSLYSLVNVWLFYYMAVRERRYGYILLGGSVSLIASLALFGSSLTRVVAIVIGAGVALYLGGEMLLWARGSEL